MLRLFLLCGFHDGEFRGGKAGSEIETELLALRMEPAVVNIFGFQNV